MIRELLNMAVYFAALFGLVAALLYLLAPCAL
jgi:hypothetical protein